MKTQLVRNDFQRCSSVVKIGDVEIMVIMPTFFKFALLNEL